MSPDLYLTCPPAPDASLPCLLPLLGDPCLLWVLREAGSLGRVVLRCPDPAILEPLLARWVAEGLLAECPACQDLEAPTGDLPVLRADAPFELAGRLQAARAGSPFAVDLEAPVPGQRLENRVSQARLEREARLRLNGAWMEAGVGFEDPDGTRVGPRVQLAPGVELAAGVRLEGAVTLGAGTRIGQGCVLTDVQVGSGVTFRPYCVAQRAVVGDDSQVGPFAHLREGSVLEAGVHMGNFVETKKTRLRRGAKANHLSYLGDADVGEGTNLGAGCITCNYDGFSKFQTIIGAGVFVGSDCQLVAPITVGDGALVAAGTTLTRDVPGGALAISRPDLEVREGGAERFRAKARARVGYSVKR